MSPPVVIVIVVIVGAAIGLLVLGLRKGPTAIGKPDRAPDWAAQAALAQLRKDRDLSQQPDRLTPTDARDTLAARRQSEE